MGKITRGAEAASEPVVVRDIMKTDPVTVSPQTPTLDAIELMRARGVGCLLVVERGELVGIVTAYDFLAASARLFHASRRFRISRLGPEQSYALLRGGPVRRMCEG